MGKKFDALEYKFNILNDELAALTEELKAGKVIAKRNSGGMVPFPCDLAINLVALEEAAQEDRDRFDAVLDHLNIRLEEVKRKEVWVVVMRAPRTNNPRREGE